MARRLKIRRDRVEGVLEAGSNQRHRGDGGNRDQGGEQPVFDRSRPILVLPKLHQCDKRLKCSCGV